MESSVIQPTEYYKSFLVEKIRPDGRKLKEVRKVTVNVGAVSTANGSALVKLGETIVMCGIKAELTLPTAEEPSKGFIVPNVELPPLCSSNFKPGPPCDQAQVATKFLDNLIKSCNLVDPSDLCIESDKLVWILYCDLMCLNYDGNIIDASVTALCASLQNVRLPNVTYNCETNSPTTDCETFFPFRVNCLPSAVTFSVFEGTKIIADPTAKEEEVTSGTFTVVTNEKDSVIYLERPGGAPLSDERIQTCISKALKHGAQIRKLYNAVQS